MRYEKGTIREKMCINEVEREDIQVKEATENGIPLSEVVNSVEKVAIDKSDSGGVACK